MSTSAAGRAQGVAFDRYAEWYDAFNQSKNYEGEAEYVLRQIERVAARRPQRWLDLGCGTGHHLAAWKKLGLDVEGVDRSESMIARARARHPDIPFHVASAQQFAPDGARDAVSMLFHVLNYQTTDEMVNAALARIATHLAPGGVFVFDFWNSDAVRRDPPVARVRSTQIDGRLLYRLSSPLEQRADRLVSVRLEFRWDSPDGELALAEDHVLRHFDEGELREWLRAASLTLETCDAWMTERTLGNTDWYGFVCARR